MVVATCHKLSRVLFIAMRKMRIPEIFVLEKVEWNDMMIPHNSIYHVNDRRNQVIQSDIEPILLMLESITKYRMKYIFVCLQDKNYTEVLIAKSCE